MKINFKSDRGRDLVLTDKGVADLSTRCGRDVQVELEMLAANGFTANTYNGLIKLLVNNLINTPDLR